MQHLRLSLAGRQLLFLDFSLRWRKDKTGRRSARLTRCTALFYRRIFCLLACLFVFRLFSRDAKRREEEEETRSSNPHRAFWLCRCSNLVSSAFRRSERHLLAWPLGQRAPICFDFRSPDSREARVDNELSSTHLISRKEFRRLLNGRSVPSRHRKSLSATICTRAKRAPH